MRAGYDAAGANYAEIYRSAAAYLESAAVENAEYDAWVLFEAAFHITRAQYFMECRAPLVQEAGEARVRYAEMIMRRAAHEPLQYLTHEQNFMGFDFYVDESVLIPRQDTEILVETVLKRYGVCAGETKPEQWNRSSEVLTRQPCRLLDMCTGSGCILLSLMRLGSFTEGVGADISEAALRVAEYNYERICGAGVPPVRFVKSDLFAALPPDERFDVIVCNPPYIREEEMRTLPLEVVAHEPRLALYGPENGLYFYRRLAEEAPRYLRAGGRIYMEIGCGQAADVAALLIRRHWSDIEVRKDLAGLDRVVCAGWKGRM